MSKLEAIRFLNQAAISNKVVAAVYQNGKTFSEVHQGYDFYHRIAFFGTNERDGIQELILEEVEFKTQ